MNIQYTSASNPQLQPYIGIKETQLLHAMEPAPGLFIAESRGVMDIALAQGYTAVNVVCTKKMLSDPVLLKVGDVPIYVVEHSDAAKTFGYNLPGEISALMKRKEKRDFREVLEGAKKIVVLENVENPTNLGAMMRSAAALGVDAVLLSPACTDPLYRRALRVSMGTSLLVPWAYFGKSEDEWHEKGLSYLKSQGFCTVAMALREDNITLDDDRWKKAEKTALLLGSEGYGLAASTMNGADYVAKIPMRNGVDSLNVAVAAGIAMWELCK